MSKEDNWGFNDSNESSDDGWGIDLESEQEDIPQTVVKEDDGWGFTSEEAKQPSKKPKNKKPIPFKTKALMGVGALVFVGALVGAIMLKGGGSNIAPDQTSYYELANVESDIQTANWEGLAEYIGTSYLSKEWAYFNEESIREDFYNKVMATVEFDVEQHNDLTTNIPVTLTHVDWDRVRNNSQDFDFKLIQKMYQDREIKKTNYEFKKELTNLLAHYVVSLDELPTKTTEIELELDYEQDEEGNVKWQLVDDIIIDRILFSSDEFHAFIDTFGGIATGDIGLLETNPNWTAWNKERERLEKLRESEIKNLENLNKITRNSEGTVLHVVKGEIQEVLNLDKDRVGEEDSEDETSLPSDRSSTIKDRTPSDNEQDLDGVVDGVDSTVYSLEAPIVGDRQDTIIRAIDHHLEVLETNEPLPTYIKPLEKPVVPGLLIPYTWIGSYYMENEYVDDKGHKVVIEPELGDGTFERPASYDTPFVTRMKSSDGKYHDVIVTLKKILRSQDAIDHVLKLDNRNRGFDTSSDLELVVVEYTVKNLNRKEELILDSEITLSDSEGVPVARTGTMYNIPNRSKIKPNSTAIMQDWFYTSDVDSRYMIWGKSFKREYPEKYFRVLMADPNNQIKEPDYELNEDGIEDELVDEKDKE